MRVDNKRMIPVIQARLVLTNCTSSIAVALPDASNNHLETWAEYLTSRTFSDDFAPAITTPTTCPGKIMRQKFYTDFHVLTVNCYIV